MKISEVRLNGFGKFQELSLALPSNFTLLVGPNEAGKSTIINAISGILFGFRRSQKALRDRYQPWRDPENYKASLVLIGDDGTRYLIGRDFVHDRLELFRGDGVRLEPLAETELDRVLLEGLGLNTPQLFEGVLLMRQSELNMAGQDKPVAGRLAEALGRRIAGGDSNITATMAVKAIRDKLEKMASDEGPNSLVILTAEVTTRERDLTQIDEGYRRHAALVEERDRLQTGLSFLQTDLNQLANKIDAARYAASCVETNAHLTEELENVRKRLAIVAHTSEELMKIQESRNALQIDPAAMAKARELADQISVLEAEHSVGEDAMRQRQEEIALMEKEIADTKAKLESLDPLLTDPRIQERLTSLVPVLNTTGMRLSELFPEVDRLLDKMARMTRLRHLFFTLGIPIAVAAIFADRYLPRLQTIILNGLAGSLTITCIALFIVSMCNRGAARKVSVEIDRRENEYKESKEEMGRLLQGKTPNQYQAEYESSKLYQKDLWEMEQTLVRRKEEVEAGKVGGIYKELADSRQALQTILTAAGCRDLAEMYAKSERHRDMETGENAVRGSLEALADGKSNEQLYARERDIQDQLALMARSGVEEEGDPDNLAEERRNLLKQAEETRMRLAEIRAEIRNYQEFVLARDRFEIEENIADAKIRLSRVQTIIKGLALAAKRLEDAIFEAKAGIGPELQERTGVFFASLTGGRYNEVHVDLSPAGLDIRVRVPETGVLVEPGALSTGAVDQLYFALRLALAHYLTQNEHFPLLLDEPFTSFDRRRLGETLKFLAHLSREHQIIWFTKDHGLAELTREATGIEPDVIELPNSAALTPLYMQRL